MCFFKLVLPQNFFEFKFIKALKSNYFFHKTLGGGRIFGLKKNIFLIHKYGMETVIVSAPA